MDSAPQIRFAEPSPVSVAEQTAACTYVLVIPKVEGPLMEILEKLIAALTSQGSVVLQTSARGPTRSRRFMARTRSGGRISRSGPEHAVPLLRTSGD